jgi:hypothetical protein
MTKAPRDSRKELKKKKLKTSAEPERNKMELSQ